MPVTLLQYHLNKEYITARLCENKAKPLLQCEGKCQLQKKIEKESDSNNTSSENNSFKTVTLDYFQEKTETVFHIAVPAAQELHDYYLTSYRHNFTSSIFRPPLI